MERLDTKAGSSATLLRGMELAGQPLDAVLNVKAEPTDDDEIAMQEEMKARWGIR